MADGNGSAPLPVHSRYIRARLESLGEPFRLRRRGTIGSWNVRRDGGFRRGSAAFCSTWAGRVLRASGCLSGSADPVCQARLPLGATGYIGPCSTSCWQPSCLSTDCRRCCMDAARTPAQACDDLATFSLRGERPGPAAPQGSLELSPKGTIRELMIALVALLVALVHHRRSYSVTLDNRTGPFPSPRQMRGSLRWSVTQRD